MQETLVGLERRIASLERSNARLRRTAVLFPFASVALATLLLVAAARPGPPASGRSDEVSARAFRLLDEAGVVRGAFELADGGPVLELRDLEGRPRARLRHDAEETALFLLDPAGTTRVGLAQFAHGGGGLALHGEGSVGATVLYMAGGAGRLTFYGPEGAVLHQVAPARTP